MTNKPNPARVDNHNNSNLSTDECSFQPAIDPTTKQTDNFLNTEFAMMNHRDKGGRPRLMSFCNILTCLEFKQKYACETWKGLHNCLKDKIKFGEIDFKIPHYSNFLRTVKSFLRFLGWLIMYQVNLNRQEFLNRQVRIAFVDSSAIPVCKVIRSSRHKTMAEFAEYSKSTTGWFFGFKLHIACEWDTKKVIDLKFTKAKLDDRKYLEEVMTTRFLNSKTMFVADKGYQAEWLAELAKDTGNYLLTGKKKSKHMRTLASEFDIYLLHVRARIETIFSNLKLNHFLTSTRSRSVLGYVFNYTLALFSLICGKKEKEGGFAI
jgi:hypothetical protein